MPAQGNDKQPEGFAWVHRVINAQPTRGYTKKKTAGRLLCICIHTTRGYTKTSWKSGGAQGRWAQCCSELRTVWYRYSMCECNNHAHTHTHTNPPVSRRTDCVRSEFTIRMGVKKSNLLVCKCLYNYLVCTKFDMSTLRVFLGSVHFQCNLCRWSPDVIWVHDVVVQWNGESFRAEGLRNVAIPCDSSQECFYVSYLSYS